MASTEYPFNFEDLLGRMQQPADPFRVREGIEDRSILITGAGGSIGSQLSETVLSGHPRRLVVLDLSEHALYRVSMRLSEAGRDLQDGPAVIPVLGSVCDSSLLRHIFARYKPDVIYHAAAFKHVPLMEQNPFAAVTNNAVGTHTLAEAALCCSAGKLILISTDKAVNPQSVMGASKRVAELVLLSLSNSQTRMTSIRLGNVFGSQGSVAPLFFEQIERGGPVTVTHPEVRRYFLTLREAVDRILEGAALNMSGRIVVPEMGEPVRVLDLANAMIERYGTSATRVHYTGLRPGDKLDEELMSVEERHGAVVKGKFSILSGPILSTTMLAARIQELVDSARTYDEDGMFTSLHELVPECKLAREAIS